MTKMPGNSPRGIVIINEILNFLDSRLKRSPVSVIDNGSNPRSGVKNNDFVGSKLHPGADRRSGQRLIYLKPADRNCQPGLSAVSGQCASSMATADNRALLAGR